MIRTLATILAVSLLAACGGETSTLRLVTSVQTQALPDIDYPPDPQLRPVQYDVPRDSSKQALPNSNIFLGFDQANWEAFQENWERIKARDAMWRARIDEVNRQRREAREKAGI
jgi:hypothetical protein